MDEKTKQYLKYGGIALVVVCLVVLLVYLLSGGDNSTGDKKEGLWGVPSPEDIKDWVKKESLKDGPYRYRPHNEPEPARHHYKGEKEMFDLRSLEALRRVGKKKEGFPGLDKLKHAGVRKSASSDAKKGKKLAKYIWGLGKI